MTTRVLCLGDLMVDVLALLPTPLNVGSDTPAPVTLDGGGSAANTAAWLAATGVPTTLVGRVGDDALGRMLLGELRRRGLELDVSLDPEHPTGTCIVLVDASGERTMIPSAGANAELARAAPHAVPPEAHVHVSGYALFQAGSRPAAVAVLAAARTAGQPVSVDAASAAPLREFGAESFLATVGRALLFANLDEAEVLTGTREAERAARLLAARTGAAVVKCGAEAAVWSDGAAVQRAVPQPATVVDSTGAGDAFAAGFLAATVRGRDVHAALVAGNAAAARAITQVGARPPS